MNRSQIQNYKHCAYNTSAQSAAIAERQPLIKTSTWHYIYVRAVNIRNIYTHTSINSLIKLVKPARVRFSPRNNTTARQGVHNGGPNGARSGEKEVRVITRTLGCINYSSLINVNDGIKHRLCIRVQGADTRARRIDLSRIIVMRRIDAAAAHIHDDGGNRARPYNTRALFVHTRPSATYISVVMRMCSIAIRILCSISYTYPPIVHMSFIEPIIHSRRVSGVRANPSWCFDFCRERAIFPPCLSRVRALRYSMECVVKAA